MILSHIGKPHGQDSECDATPLRDSTQISPTLYTFQWVRIIIYKGGKMQGLLKEGDCQTIKTRQPYMSRESA